MKSRFRLKFGSAVLKVKQIFAQKTSNALGTKSDPVLDDFKHIGIG